jgi:heme-degrading monooxygenase HmoA
MIAQIVRFKSGLSDERVLATYEARAPQYRALKGLKQKYYLKFSETDEHGAVYLWDSKASLEAFRKSDLASTIPTAYQVEGAPDVTVAEWVMTLRPE